MRKTPAQQIKEARQLAKIKRTTDKYLAENPFIHVTLFHHHEITMAKNEIKQPSDDTIVTFEFPDGSEYNIKYAELKKRAAEEQEKLPIKNDGDNPEGVE